MSLIKKATRPSGFQKGKSGNPAGMKPGTKHKVSKVAARRVLEAAIRDAQGKVADKDAKALTPLGFMENVLRTPSAYPFAARQWAAHEAAPYLHRKMPIAIDGGEGKPIPVMVLDSAKLAAMDSDTLRKAKEVIELMGIKLDD